MAELERLKADLAEALNRLAGAEASLKLEQAAYKKYVRDNARLTREVTALREGALKVADYLTSLNLPGDEAGTTSFWMAQQARKKLMTLLKESG